MISYTLYDDEGNPLLDLLADDEEEAWNQVRQCGIRNLSKTMEMVVNI